MSTLTTVVTSVSPYQDWPVSLTTRGQQDLTCKDLDQCLQEARDRELCSAFEVGMMMGSIFNTLALEKLQLESENRKLEADITQFKMVHAAELNAAIDKREAKRSQVAAKLEFLVVKVDAFCKKWSQMGVSLIDAGQLRALSSSVAKISYADLRTYPKYSDVRNKASPSEDVVTVHTRDLLSHIQTPPALLQMTLKRTEEYGALQAKTAPIRATTLALIDTKELMTHFHAHYLTTIHAPQREERLEHILGAVRSVYSQVKWGTTLQPSQCSRCQPSDMYPEDVAYLHGIICKAPLEKNIKKIQGLMLDLISTLESFVNPQRAGT